MEIIQALEDSNILHKGITKKLKVKQKTRTRIFRNTSRHSGINLARKFIIR